MSHAGFAAEVCQPEPGSSRAVVRIRGLCQPEPAGVPQRPAVLHDDPDADPRDAAGVPGHAVGEGVGPGGDPERFGDLVEQ